MKKLICFIVVMSFIMVSKSDAVMLTEDVANLPHNILTGVNTMQSITEAVKQYKLLMDEYKMMAKNMAAISIKSSIKSMEIRLYGKSILLRF